MSKDDEPPQGGQGHGGKDEVSVRFTHLVEREKAKFDVDPERTLQSIWNQSYDELEVAKTDRDVLQAPAKHKHDNPVSLMDHLSLSLREAQRRELCDDEFEIAAGTGGA